VSRDNQEPKVLYTQKVMHKQHMNGVSNAFWPSNVRRGVHTNKVAQLRRIIIMLGIELMNTWKLWHIYCQYLASTYMSLHRLVQMICIGAILGMAMILAVFYDWGAMLKHWFAFLLCIILCIFATLIIVYVWLGNRRTRKHESLMLNLSHASLAGIPVAQMAQASSLVVSSNGASIPQTHLPTLLPFPETPMPMPATPLIRVLETIDLSSTNVKHFLDIRPHSSMNILKDGETN
jgi:hypothetical protein